MDSIHVINASQASPLGRLTLQLRKGFKHLLPSLSTQAIHSANESDLIICALVAIEMDLILGEVDEKGPLCIGNRGVVFLRKDSHIGIGN